MKRQIGLFVIVGMLLSAGVASADRGFWYSANGGASNGWQTFFNIVNTGAQQDAKVEFFEIDGTYMGATTTTLSTNQQWNFSTETVGVINATVFDAVPRGTVIISGTAAGTIRGYASVFSNTGQSGFNLRIRTSTTDDNDPNW